MKKKIKITLESDLCIGSGLAYAGVIDSDICYDQYGFPYIPAKRLKGCLREAAELIHNKEQEKIFGKSGNAIVGELTIDNAYLEDYEKTIEEIKKIKMHKVLAKYYSEQSLLNLYTSVKAQTKIEEGVAKNNSLRYTRLVNQYSPINGEKLTFFAEVNIGGKLEKELETICKALRNIGMNRNRGLGAVTCQLIDINSEISDIQLVEKRGEICEKQLEDIDKGEKEDYVLSYHIQNEGMLILSGNKNAKTETYIRAQSIIGCLAGAYLKEHGLDDRFEDLFVKGKVKYSNLYPLHEQTNQVCYPAPMFLRKMKIQGNILNIATKEGEAQDKEEESEEIYKDTPKLLKNQYMSMVKTKLGKYMFFANEVETELVYHNGKLSKKNKIKSEKDDGGLYTIEAIQKKQIFTGEIHGKRKEIKELYCLLQKTNIRIGQSKSAQYGKCEVSNIKIKRQDETKEFLDIQEKNAKIVVALLSDAIFLSPETGYTVQYHKVKEMIAEQLHLTEKIDLSYEKEDRISQIKARVLTGYYQKWNLQKQAIPVVEAGSVFAFRLNETIKGLEREVKLGVRNHEGLGWAKVFKTDEFVYDISETEEKEKEQKKDEDKEENKIEDYRNTRELSRKLILSQMEESLKEKVIQEKLKSPIDSAAFLGRVTLMLQEARNKSAQRTEEVFNEFEKRVRSVKDKKRKKELLDYMEKYFAKKEKKDENRLVLDIEKYTSKEEIELLEKIAPDTYQEDIKQLWEEYFMTQLLCMRYQLKEEEKENGNDSKKKVL